MDPKDEQEQRLQGIVGLLPDHARPLDVEFAELIQRLTANVTEVLGIVEQQADRIAALEQDMASMEADE
jgi:hypothetical protein